MNLPISYIVLKLGAPAPAVMVVAIVISQICLFLRLWFLRKMIHMPMRLFLSNVYLKAIAVAAASLPVPLGLYFVMPPSISRLITIAVASILITSANVYLFGCDTSEKQIVRNQFNKLKLRFCNS